MELSIYRKPSAVEAIARGCARKAAGCRGAATIHARTSRLRFAGADRRCSRRFKELTSTDVTGAAGVSPLVILGWAALKLTAAAAA